MADVFEMLWDCPNCDTKGLLGKTHRYCPACGGPQAPDRRYFPTSDQEVAVENHTFDGVDRVCPACATPNGAKSEFCSSCGSPLDEGKAVKLVAAGHSAKERALVGAEPAPAPAEAKSAPGCLKWVALTVVVLSILCGVWMFWTKDAGVTIAGTAWERTIAVERFEPVAEDAWRDSVPSGAYDLSCREKQRSTNKVPDGQDCQTVSVDQGDGTFRKEQKCTTKYREEPVMGTWCNFKVDKWHTVDTAKSNGDGRDRAWPTVRADGCQTLGCTREGARAETHTVNLTLEDGTTETCTVDEPTWTAAEAGESWHVDVHVLGGAIDCGSLREQP
jgi:hypothetical protein